MNKIMRLLALFIFCIYCQQGNSQTSFGAKLKGGYSMAGNHNLMTTKVNGGFGIYMAWDYKPKLLGYAELSSSLFQNENPRIKWKRMDIISCGIGKDLLKEKNKLRIFFSPLFARCTLKPQTGDELKLTTSHWTQWCLKIG